MARVTLNLYLKDEERCALGRGWEARRSNRPITSNPFPPRSWQWEAFREGWLNFKVSDAQK